MGSAKVPLHKMVKVDYLYLTTWSLFEDVKVLVRTVPYMLARRGMLGLTAPDGARSTRGPAP